MRIGFSTADFRRLVVVAALFTCSCTSPVASIPPVPTPALEGVAPEVRDVVLAAHKEAEAAPRDGKASGHFGMVLQANTLYPTAVLAYRRAIQLEPKEFSWPYYLALTLQQQSNLEEALTTLSAALRIQPDYAPALAKQGDLLFELGRLQESAAILEPLVAKYPKSAEALYALARVKYAQDDLPAAEDLYRRAIAAYPAFGTAYFGLAQTGKRLGHDTESDKNFDLAERYKGNGPQGTDPLLNQMLALGTGLVGRIQQAQQLVLQGKPQEASKVFQEVLKQDPDNLDGLLNILYVGPIEGKPSASEMDAYYARARKIAPQNPQIYLYYGMTLTNYSKEDAAIAAVNKAVELKPDYAEAYALLGTLLERKNRPDQAIQQYRKALAAQPDYRPAQLQLARVLVTLSRYKEAIPELHRLLEVDDANTPITMVFLAQAYANTGDVAKAQEYLQHAHARVRTTGPPALLQQIEQGLRELGSRP